MIVVTYGLLIVNTHGRGMWVKHMYINGEHFNKPLELRKPESLGGQPYC